MYETDTIAAIATPPGRGALGVVRLSGVGAVDVARRMFVLAGKKAWRVRSHYMEYGTIMHEGQTVDEVMLCAMLAPRSFTREDVVEIYAHGGALSLQGVLDAALECGARLARAGEFTRRAFLNGRINLSQAEAVMDIIHAGSEAARAAGLRQLGGGLTRRVGACRDAVLRWLAHISLSIDYPEHEEEAMNRTLILAEGRQVLADMDALLATAEVGRRVREGIQTAIVGAPNAGKSTLLNALLGQDRALVHELPGTTRDILTEQVQIGGLALVLMDTAGLRETTDAVEQMGVARSQAAAQAAALVLHVVDASAETQPVWEAADNQQVITVWNKCDLVADAPSGGVAVSAKTGQGLTDLIDAIRAACLDASAMTQEDFGRVDVLTRVRHKELLAEARAFLSHALSEFAAGVAEDMVAISLRGAYLSLGHILGEEYADDIVDRIFAEFCVGK